MILLRQRGTHTNRDAGWGHGTEGWDDGGGGYDDAMSVGDGRCYVAPMQARIGMDMAFESRVRSVAMCVSQLYLLEQVINQRTDAPVQRSIEMTQDSMHPAPQGGTVERVWKSGPPPHIGWWLTGDVEWRWWDGSVWSYYVLPLDDAATARIMAAKPNKLYTGSWCDYYPENARVPRVDPSLPRNRAIVEFINMTPTAHVPKMWEDAAWKDYRHKYHLTRVLGTDTPTVREMKERMTPPPAPPVPPGYVAGSRQRLSEAVRVGDVDFSGAMKRNQDPGILRMCRRADNLERVDNGHYIRLRSNGQVQAAVIPEVRELASYNSIELMKELFRRFNATP